MLCNGLGGSVKGYCNGAFSYKAIRASDKYEDKVHIDYIREFQEGVLSGVTHFSNLSAQRVYYSKEFLSTSQDLFYSLIATPNRLVIKAYKSLNHDETFGTGGFVRKNIDMSYIDLLISCYHRNKRKAFFSQLEATGWPQAVILDKKVSLLLKLYNQKKFLTT